MNTCTNCKVNLLLLAQKHCGIPNCDLECQCHVCINCFGCNGCCLVNYEMEKKPFPLTNVKYIIPNNTDVHFTENIISVRRPVKYGYYENQNILYGNKLFKVRHMFHQTDDDLEFIHLVLFGIKIDFPEHIINHEHL